MCPLAQVNWNASLFDRPVSWQQQRETKNRHLSHREGTPFSLTTKHADKDLPLLSPNSCLLQHSTATRRPLIGAVKVETDFMELCISYIWRHHTFLFQRDSSIKNKQWVCEFTDPDTRWVCVSVDPIIRGTHARSRAGVAVTIFCPFCDEWNSILDPDSASV